MSKILLVEDSRTQALTYTRVLEEDGHTVEHVTTVAEGVEACIERTPDLVLLDYYLAEGSGVDLCSRLKMDEMLQIIPVIVLTASRRKEDEIKALSLGADAFLSKDCSDQELLAMTSRLVESAIIKASARMQSGSASLAWARVLLIDDSRVYLEQLGHDVTKAGFQVTKAQSGPEALGLLDETNFDIAVCDIVMPDMDGFEVCRRLRKWALEHQWQMGLLVLSGKESKDMLIQSLSAGADDFISKSASTKVLIAHIVALARRIGMVREIQSMNEKVVQHELELEKARWKQEQAEERARFAEELERSNRELEQFGYIISHDLQAPLRTISSFCQLLAKRNADKLDDDSQTWMSHVVDGTTRMKTLIDELLKYSRVKKSDEPPEDVDLAEAVDLAVNSLHAEIEASGATVTHTGLPSLPANRMQINQLFQNLIGNALKYRAERTPEVGISAEQSSPTDGGEWIVSVRDNGIGIDPQHSERIFQVFQRLHTEKEYRGTGIGLAICKKTVELHGGRIWVESESGQGSVFYFTIPMSGDGSV